jgi:8-oxo-dGTP pyrophosphatase MutT (NUDIX family)
MTTFENISRLLALCRPASLECHAPTRAAVALILREREHGPEALFIERAAREGDPWSGDIGFPGGKFDKEDDTPRQTAERETLEEIGLDLRGSAYLGHLCDITGARLPVLVSCYVYGTGDIAPFILNHEVRDLFWVSLADLDSPERHITAQFQFDGEFFVQPAISLPQSGKPLLWGITYRFVMEFLRLFRESAAADEPKYGSVTQELTDKLIIKV